MLCASLMHKLLCMIYNLLQLLSVCQYQAWILVLQKTAAEGETETQ